LAEIADIGHDIIVRTLATADLPKRVRIKPTRALPGPD